MSRRIAVVGDPTTTGGKIITGQPSFFSGSRHIACQGDKVTCPACKSIGTIIEGEGAFIIEGKAAALDRYQIACGCPAGTNRIIAIHSDIYVEDTSKRQAQAQTSSGRTSASTLSGSHYGSSSSNNTINANKETKKDESSLVFAKSCFSDEVRTTKENASNFGELLFFQFKSTQTQNNNQFAYAGAIQLIGHQIATQGMRIAIPKLAISNPVALGLIGLLYSSEVGKGSDQIAAVHYEAMMKRMVKTRVRFFWGTGIDGISRPYGHHVQGLQGDVPSIEMLWNEQYQRYESARYNQSTPTILWTPAGEVQLPTHTGHPHPEIDAPIFVHPIDESGKDSITPPFPAPEAKNFNDYILIFPIDSGLPPVYIFISEQHKYHAPPKGNPPLPAFPEAKTAPRKTSVRGGGSLRARWKDRKNIYEWDSRHGTVEKYNGRGQHLGEFNHETGEQTKPADPTRKIEP